jgi:glycosyltransferase involved in cell wall biosynthesis
MVLSQADKAFIISEFGAVEARRAGVMEAEHLQIGVDTETWQPATPEEKKAFRSAMLGIDDDTFIVLTIADNQERKNLAAAMEIFACFIYEISIEELQERQANGTINRLIKKKNALYVLVTRENSPVGWRLRDYAQELGILNKFMLFERGMPFKELWMMYACADCFLLTSKSEGLGMPLLEAMSMKIPCIGTDCTGMAELLGDGRGFLVDPEYTHRDPFGNGTRWWINKDNAVTNLQSVYAKILPDIEGARKYVEGRDWQPSVIRLEEVLLKLRSEREPIKENKE